MVLVYEFGLFHTNFNFVDKTPACKIHKNLYPMKIFCLTVAQQMLNGLKVDSYRMIWELYPSEAKDLLGQYGSCWPGNQNPVSA